MQLLYCSLFNIVTQTKQIEIDSESDAFVASKWKW